MKVIIRFAAVSLLLVFPLQAQNASPDELRKALSNMASMLDTAYYIEGFKMLRGSLPAVNSPREFARVLFDGTASGEWLVDPWGTPYEIHVTPSEGTYVIVSAGSDRIFERPTPTERRTAVDTAADVVLRNGEFIRSPREWVFAQLKAVGFDPATALENAIQISKAKRSMADARSIATALEVWAIDHDHQYPAAGSLDALAQQIAPKYIGDVPRTDGWGTEYHYLVTADRRGYAIVSAGSDRKFESTVATKRETVADFAQDLVISKGEFVRQWQIQSPSTQLQEAFSSLTAREMRLIAVRNGSPEEREYLAKTLASPPIRLAPPQRLAGSREDALKSADEAAKAGDVLTAFRIYRDVQFSDPEFDDPARFKRYDDAFTQWRLKRPQAPAEQYAEGRELAIAVLQPFVAKHPEQERAVDRLNELLMEDGKSHEAISFLESIVSKHPNNERAIVLLSKDLAKEGRFSEALQFIEQHASGFTDRTSLVRAQANVMIGARRAVDAISITRKLVAAEPKNLDARLLLADETWSAFERHQSGVKDADVIAMIETTVQTLKKLTAKEVGDRGLEVYSDLALLLNMQADYESDSAKRSALKSEADHYDKNAGSH